MRSRLAAVLLLLGLLLPVAMTAEPENHPDPQFGRSRSGAPPPPSINDREHVKARSEERQKQLKADTEKLLELATELKQYVDKTNESVLSVEVIKKTQDIEKLAKSVREKMKGN
jgi:hypothetical protein